MIYTYRIGLWHNGILYTVDVKYDHMSKGKMSYPLKVDGLVSLTFDSILDGYALDSMNEDVHITDQILGKIEQILQARNKYRNGAI